MRKHPLAWIVALAVLLRAFPWVLPNTLLGVMEVDDGVYYAASKLLLHGYWPYADFTIVHPPLTSLLLLPFAAFGVLLGDPAGMAAARLAMGGVGVVNVLLVHRLALRMPTPDRFRNRAALVAAATYAVMPHAVEAEHTVLLEPLVNLACLLAVLLLLRSTAPRPAVLAGVLLTAACGFKLFAGAYVVAVLLWLVVSHRRTQVKPTVLGLLLGTALLVLPFFLRDPSAFWTDVVVTQLSRPAVNTLGGLVRMLDQVLPHAVALAVLAAMLAGVVALGVAYERRSPGSPLTLWIIVGGLGSVAFVNSPSYFPHYGAFLVPPLAMGLSRLVIGERPWWRGTAAVAVLLTGFTVGSVRDIAVYGGQGNFSEAGALIPQDSCVFYEAISLVIAADDLTLPRADCPAWVDGRGLALTWNADWPPDRDFYPEGFASDTRWQAETLIQLQHADFLMLTDHPNEIGEWAPATRDYALTHFAPVWTQREGRVVAELWKRTTPANR